MTQSEKLLTIAIPSWRNWNQLVNCLLTLTRYTEFPYKIVVINNGDAIDADGNDFAVNLKKIIPFKDLEVVTPGGNLGWQKAINYAFEEHCDTPYFCMANDDLVFLPNSLSFWWELVGCLKFPNVAAAGPASNYVMGSQNIQDHRGGANVFESTLLIGFLMVVRSEAFSEIGGLDDYLPGGDDLDLSILFRKSGYRLVVNRMCYVHHIGAQTGVRVEGSYWNSPMQVELTNNYLIRKHGVRAWYDCVSSKVKVFEDATQMSDVEGDIIREKIGNDKQGLDVGCGGNKTIATAIGVDKDATGSKGDAGGRKWTECQSDVVADASDLPFASETQDYIIARHIFEHLVDPIRALDEWRRVLKPGGLLAIACPDEDVTNTMLVDWTHKHAWTPTSLRRIAEEMGFKSEEEYLVRPGFSFVSFLRKAA